MSTVQSALSALSSSYELSQTQCQDPNSSGAGLAFSYCSVRCVAQNAQKALKKDVAHSIKLLSNLKKRIKLLSNLAEIHALGTKQKTRDDGAYRPHRFGLGGDRDLTHALTAAAGCLARINGFFLHGPPFSSLYGAYIA